MYHGKEADPFYKGKPWRRAREAALERDHWICQDCLAAKRRGERKKPPTATIVHHIISRKERPDLELALDNLISLCEACHNKRHPEKGGSPRSRKNGSIWTPQGVRVIKV